MIKPEQVMKFGDESNPVRYTWTHGQRSSFVREKKGYIQFKIFGLWIEFGYPLIKILLPHIKIIKYGSDK